jgi:hypothetical protein
MIIYLAGPMTGLPRHNFDAFDDATAEIERAGHCVVSPANLSRGLGATDWEGNTIECDDTNRYATCMRRDIQAVMLSDAIYVLSGWQESRGAKIEVALAQVLAIPVIDYSSGLPIKEIVLTKAAL